MLIEPAASDLRFYIECQVGMFARLFAFIISIFRPTIFWIMFYHFTAPAVFSQVRSAWLRVMIRYDRWIRVRMLVHTASWTSACCFWPRCVSLAQTWRPCPPPTVFWQSACSWLLKRHSAFLVLLVHGMMWEVVFGWSCFRDFRSARSRNCCTELWGLMCCSYQNIWPEWATTPSLACVSLSQSCQK